MSARPVVVFGVVAVVEPDKVVEPAVAADALIRAVCGARMFEMAVEGAEAQPRARAS